MMMSQEFGSLWINQKQKLKGFKYKTSFQIKRINYTLSAIIWQKTVYQR